MAVSEQRKKYLREWRAKNRERVNQQSRAYAARHPQRRSESSIAHDRRFPEKKAARKEVHKAILRGALKKQPCVDCGISKAQAHHEDYSKPLDVTWLCAVCHGKRHYA